MKPHPTIVVSGMCLALLCLLGEVALGQNLPLVKGKKVVASINGEPITLDELNQEVASMARGTKPDSKIDRKAELDVLKRMINTRLIVQEARNIGLDKLPEVRMMVDSFAKEALREDLAQKIIRDVKADQGEVEKIYRESIQEWKVSAILCEKEEDAKKLETELTTGRNFGEVAKEFLAERRAQKIEDGVYVKSKDMDPQYAEILSRMVAGSISPIIRRQSGFVILRLDDIRYTDNPDEREKAKQIALTSGKREALKAFDEALKKKYVKVNRDLLESIDYESKTPGFEALLKDTRVVAEIKGDQPVTVGEMTEQLKYQLYHGAQEAADMKKLNARKDAVLDGLLHRRLFRREALRQGLDKTESYRGNVREYETGVVFGMFINKVIVPDIKLKEDEVKAFYDEHLKEYAAPEMMKFRSLVFAKRGDAEIAIERLRGGAEFQWVAAHSEGQVDRDAKGVLSFDDRLIITDQLPEGVRKAIAGAKVGDIRLYASTEGHIYVLTVLEVVPSNPQPYAKARSEIAQRLFQEKQKKAVEDYADKLRSLSDVKVYLKG